MVARLSLIILVCGKLILACPENSLDCVDKCLADGHTVKCLFEWVTNDEQHGSVGRSEKSRLDIVEEHLWEKLADILGFSRGENGRADNMLRTYRRAWKILIPLLIGVKLKLATFVPMLIVVLTLMAKGALFSANLAVFFSAFNLFLKYFYPKWSGEQHGGHNSNQHHQHHQHHDHNHQFETFYSKEHEPYQHFNNYNTDVS